MKPVLLGVVRHLLGFAGVWLASKGIDVDQGTINQVSDVIIGLVLSGSAIGLSVIDKKPVQDIVSTVAAPKGFYFGLESKSKLKGVDKRLVNLMEAAIVSSPYDFKITQGLRTSAEQEQMRKAGKSLVKRSKHQDGLAVDIMAYDENGKPTWDMKYYKAISEHVKSVAREEDIAIVWGGDWKNLVDGVHYELV